jgi:hypothetical protein
MTPAIAALFSRPKNINARCSYSRATEGDPFSGFSKAKIGARQGDQQASQGGGLPADAAMATA